MERNKHTENDQEFGEGVNMENLKPDINNLLFMYLPEQTTLKEFEELACRIHHTIYATKNQIEQKS